MKLFFICLAQIQEVFPIHSHNQTCCGFRVGALRAQEKTHDPKGQTVRNTTRSRSSPAHCRHYLEGQGDLVSRLITPRTHIVTLFIPIINLLTKGFRV